jgi:hypothetical protein
MIWTSVVEKIRRHLVVTPNFWLLNADSGNDRPTFSRHYLEVVRERYRTNRRVSERQARTLEAGQTIGTVKGTARSAPIRIFGSTVRR